MQTLVRIKRVLNGQNKQTKQTEDTILTSSLAYNVLFYNQENVKKPDSKKTNINIIQNIYKYIQEREKEDYLKMCICDKNNIIFGGIMKMLKEVKNVTIEMDKRTKNIV